MMEMNAISKCTLSSSWSMQMNAISNPKLLSSWLVSGFELYAYVCAICGCMSV